MEKLRPSDMLDWCIANLDKEEYDTYRSDLYIKKTPKTEEAIQGLEPKSLLSTFSSAIDGTPWYEIPFGALGAYAEDQHKALVTERLITLEMRFQELGANLVHFMDDGFDPDAYYTPTERALGGLCESIGYDYRIITQLAYERLKRGNSDVPAPRRGIRK